MLIISELMAEYLEERVAKQDLWEVALNSRE